MSAKMLRWQIDVDDVHHELPVSGDVVAVATNITGRLVEFWTCAVDGVAPTPRTFRVFGTGQPVPDGWFHRGTTARTPTGLVWHLFERGGGNAR